jgi:hypothetical protein
MATGWLDGIPEFPDIIFGTIWFATGTT